MLSLRIPSWVAVIFALLVAFPCGWAVGVVAALIVAGPNFGQLPLFTVPAGIIASFLFALLPVLTPWIRLAIMIGIVAAFIFGGMILVR